jgi:hypothetical protein
MAEEDFRFFGASSPARDGALRRLFADDASGTPFSMFSFPRKSLRQLFRRDLPAIDSGMSKKKSSCEEVLLRLICSSQEDGTQRKEVLPSPLSQSLSSEVEEREMRPLDVRRLSLE